MPSREEMPEQRDERARLTDALAKARYDRDEMREWADRSSGEDLTSAYLSAFDDRAVLAGEIERLRRELAILHVNIADALANIEQTDADAIKRAGNTLFALSRRAATPPNDPAARDAADEGRRP